MFYQKYVLIFIFIVYHIKSEQTVPIWENNKKVSELDISNIESYAIDEETGAELYLFNENGESLFYLLVNSTGVKIKNNLDLTDIESQLIQLDSKYFFCSSSSQKLFWIENNIIYSKTILSENDNDDSYKIRIMKTTENNHKSVMIAYTGINYLYVFDPSNNEVKKYNLPDNKKNEKIDKILAISTFTMTTFLIKIMNIIILFY